MTYQFSHEDKRTGCTMLKCAKHGLTFARVEPGCPKCEEEQNEEYDRWRKEVIAAGDDPDNMDDY